MTLNSSAASKPIATVPFNRPSFVGKEREYILESIASGHVAGDGKFTARCHNLLEKMQGRRALLTTSCTHALEMAALLLEIRPGDEIIVPSFTFVSTANAFVLRGARPVFVDVRRDTLNLDEHQLAPRLSDRTRVVVPVHYAGIACEMDAITSLAEEHGIEIVEDNAHGFLGKYRGRLLGTFGALSTLSFHATKNFQCGEGGALVINRHDLMERAEIIREKGTNRSKFYRGHVDKYTWVDLGSSYLPSDLLAAVLLAQLEASDHIVALRRAIFERYQHELKEWADQNGVLLPTVPEHCEPAYHLFYLLLPTLAIRSALMAHLDALGVSSVFHYLPLHLSPMGRRFGGRVGDCPVTEDVSDRLLRLPFYTHLQSNDQMRVIDGIRAFASF